MKSSIKPFLIVLIIIQAVWLPITMGSEMAGFNFLRTHIGARPSGMAGAFVAISNDVHALYFNPAGITNISKNAVSVTYLNHVLDFQSGFIGYAQPVKNVATVGVGIHYLDYGTFDRTDKNGQVLGTFGASNVVLTAGIGKEFLPGLLTGANVKYIRSNIDSYSATAYAVDFGVIYSIPFTDDLDVGLAIKNVGSSTSAFIKTREDLPLNIVVGFSKKLAHLPLLINVNLYKYMDDDFQFIIGGEFALAEGVFLRLGYNSVGRDQQVEGELDRFAGGSVGLGFNWQTYYFDYSLSSLGEVGSLNRLTFSMRF